MWSSADDNAERAQAEYQDTRTPDQKRWDSREYAAASKFRALVTLTRQSHIGWARDPQTLAAIDSILSDAMREVRALVVEGMREGDPVKPITKLSQIEARPVVCGINGEDAA